MSKTAEALKYLRMGFSPTDAAAAAGVSVAAVSRHPEAKAIAAMRAQFPQDLRPLPTTYCSRTVWAARRLVAAGMSLSEVAAMVRITTRTLYRDDVIARYAEARRQQTRPGVYALPDWNTEKDFIFVDVGGNYVSG
jgi:AcrR family transcriptional regulator